MLKHEDFVDELLEYIGSDRKEYKGSKAKDNGELTAPVPYGKREKLFLLNEPLTFIHEMNKCSSLKECFDKRVLRGKYISLPKEAVNDQWWNTTRDQINLRFGRECEHNAGLPIAMPLGDKTVHALIAGQTGSGKSVLMHNLIFNLMMEYPPWELDLYLADFKRVEFSKYMTGSARAPHIAACAATSEIRYVISLIRHLVDCMNAREDFLKIAGFQKIAKFREARPDMVLPRILLIVDEFQQLFLEASVSESEQIHRMLTAIVKKGRATGVHIIFASQDLSQTLSRPVLSNFRMRVALNCDPNVSMDVLGNRKAASCETGYVYVNNSDYSEKTNRRFEVPHINMEPTQKDKADAIENGEAPVSHFDGFLEVMRLMAESLGYKKVSKFYQEDHQEPIEELTKILEKIRPFREDLEEQYFDALTLGRYVTYCSQKHDIQTLFIERGRNRNILAVSPNTEDICYIQKLLAENFNSRGNYVHEVYSYMPAAENIYSLFKELKGDTNINRDPDSLAELQERFDRMRILLPIYKEAESPLHFALLNYNRNIEEAAKHRPDLKQSMERFIPVITEKFQKVTFENYADECANILRFEEDRVIRKLAENTADFCRYKHDPDSVLYTPTVIWINGVDIIERIPEWLTRMMQNGMDYNLLFVCMAGGEFDAMSQIAKYCDYLFLGGSNRRIYDRLGVNFTARDPDSIVLDMVIKSSGEERSFKKYRCSFISHESARIPFEKYLS